MTSAEELDRITDKESVDNIKEIADEIAAKVKPLKIILFGSFAKGSYTEDSDFDFYIVVDDGRDVKETMCLARRATIYVKKRPVDIVVGTNSRFEMKRKMDYTQMIEGEVEREGILLYER